MFKAVKMKRLKFLLLSFVLGCAMLAGAQTPEVFPLWPQGVKENNGIKVDRTVDDQGGTIVQQNCWFFILILLKIRARLF